MDWDVIVNEEIKFKWKKLLRNLEKLSLLRVKRFAFVRVEERIISAHGFCCNCTIKLKRDCAVVYLRVKTSVAVKVLFFWQPKPKIAPLKEF